MVLYLRRMLETSVSTLQVSFIMKLSCEIGVEGVLYDVFYQLPGTATRTINVSLNVVFDIILPPPLSLSVL